MKYAWLVALREFAENAKTKGFWVGLLMFPIMIVIGMQVPQFLREKATPTRNFVLVDRSGKYEEIVERSVRRHQARVKNEAFGTYVQKHLKEEYRPESSVPDTERISGDMNQMAKLLLDLEKSNPEILDYMASEEGWATTVAMAEAQLVEDRPDFDEPRLRFRRIELPESVDANAKEEDLLAAMKPYLLGEESLNVDGESEELFAFIYIPEDAEEHVVRSLAEGAQESMTVNPEDSSQRRGVQYWTTNLADQDLKQTIERSLNSHVRELEYQTVGVDSQIVRQVEDTYLPMKTLNPKKEVGKEEASMADIIRQWAPVGFVYLLWVAIFTVAQMLLNNTIEEKSNRIIEVLLSSVTPWELMLGKLIGIAAIGITMLVSWIIALVGVLYWKAGPEAEWALEIYNVVVSSNLIPLFLVYFFLGYLFYAGVFLAIGSICNTLKEAQNFMGPIMMVMMVPLITMMFIPRDPNGTLATILSWIPLYTPFVMMNRAAADPPMFDLVVTMVMMVVAVIVAMWLSAKIFRIGILRTGQPPKLMELIRWIKN